MYVTLLYIEMILSRKSIEKIMNLLLLTYAFNFSMHYAITKLMHFIRNSNIFFFLLLTTVFRSFLSMLIPHK